jgi:PAS domain S-box-containing protein
MFELLFERSADAIWLFDPRTGVFVDCNQAAVDLMRAGTKERLLQLRPEDLSPPIQPDGTPSGQKSAEVVERAAKNGGYRFEWVARRMDGEDVPLEVLTTPIPTESGTLYVTVSRDISCRKKIEQKTLELNQTLERRINERTAELTASEARWRTLVDHAPEAIVVFEGDTGRFISCNENATRLYGLSREQLAVLTPYDVSPEFQPDGRPSLAVGKEKVCAALAGKTPVFEWTHRHADGHLIPCEIRLVRLPGDGPSQVRASIIDNTERKRREKIVQATFEISEAVHTTEDLADLYKHIHVVVGGLMPARNFYIALLDPNTEVITFAYHVDEVEATPPPLKMNTGLTSVVLRTGKACLVPCKMQARKRRVGNEVMFEGSPGISYVECGVPAAIWLGVPLLLQNKAIGVIAVQDYQNETAYGEQEKQILTFVAGQIALAIERKRAEQELLKTLAREKELGRLKSNFVSMVSHEFRTPLSIIQSSAEILRDYFNQLEGVEREEQLGSIVKNTRRMAVMMEEILVLSRLDAGKTEFIPKPLQLDAFLRRVVDEVFSAGDRRCPVELSLPSDAGNACADEGLLGHIFTNLLSNAVKYSQTGAVVHFDLKREGREAVCVIRDRGIGIPEDDQPWLFNAFQRGSNVGDRPGTGLGLVLVKRCVELHGGKVRIESQVGVGTTVTVRMPIFEV